MTDGLRIETVTAGSIAEEIGLEAGDRITAVNGQRLHDVLDYLFFEGEEGLELTAEGPGGEVLEAHIEKEAEEDLGLVFETGQQTVRTCANHCIFCFVDQMPPGFRPALYIKDDDWRTSFLHGSYITLTNLAPEEMDRIITQRISPLYVSVHAADSAVRSRLLGRPHAQIMPVLRKLAAADIHIFAQAVIVPGYNDGAVLEETIRKLSGLFPQVESLAVVPVGLTGCRSGCPDLPAVDRHAAQAILEIVDKYQSTCLQTLGTRFVFAADELYVRAGLPFPSAEEYEDFTQIENGVGLAADFLEEAHRALRLGGRPAGGPYLFVTGGAFAQAARNLAEELHTQLGVDLSVHTVENRTFGPACDVAGLLTGKDVIASLSGAAGGRTVLLPPVMFRDGGGVTLDNLSCAQIAAAVGAPCRVPPPGGWNFVRSLVEEEK